MNTSVRSLTGHPLPMGSTLEHNGTNFSLFSKHASEITLHLFDSPDASVPYQSFPLNPAQNRTGDIWHIFLYDVPAGTLYGYTAQGECRGKDHVYNPNKLLLDPYAKAIEGSFHAEDPSTYHYCHEKVADKWEVNTDNDFGVSPKARVTNLRETYIEGWETDKMAKIALKDSVIYEMHVKALTQDETSDAQNKGGYLGVIEKIPYFQELGITTVELLPIQLFNPHEINRENPETGERLVQFWGYSTINFFQPCPWFSSKPDAITTIKEFKTMVLALHQAGLEVILDVVYNHTAEGDERGQILSFKGLDNCVYYMLNEDGSYKNYSGCGNTLNCNHIMVKNLILDSLHYWVTEMHVDGFRFDLATILGRDENGQWLASGSLLNDINQDPILSNTKIIAEGWDAAGLYQVGNFPSRWAEWNGKFRDDIRSVVKSDPYRMGDLSTRIAGSSDIFNPNEKRKPYQSINFITAHDGFSLWDLVSYNQKHNLSNGENNTDGSNDNLSWNCGVEGETDNPAILGLRRQQIRNFLTLLFVSQGTPMLLAGDEFGFSKRGNNNTYCHDDKLNWLDWSLVHKNQDIFDFTKYLIQLRKSHESLRRSSFFEGRDINGNTLKDINWLGADGREIKDTRMLGNSMGILIEELQLQTYNPMQENHLFVAINNHWDPMTFAFPPLEPMKKWRCLVNTAQVPQNFWSESEAPTIDSDNFILEGRSIQIFLHTR